MKRLLVVLVSLMVSTVSIANAPRVIDDKLIQTFQASFPNAREVTWTEIGGSYAVSFIADGIRARVIYRKDGSFVYLTRYYLATSLPYHIRFKLKQEYPEKKPFGVTETSVLSYEGDHLKVDYYIKMEDDLNWLNVRIDHEGNLTEVEKFKKAK